MSDYGYGEKIEYLTIRLPDTDRNWCYSAEMLKAELNSLLVGQRIQAVCVSLAGFVYALYHAPNIIDLSYLGGSSLLLFEKTALELSFYAVGMLEYRLFPYGRQSCAEYMAMFRVKVYLPMIYLSMPQSAILLMILPEKGSAAPR